MFAGRSKALKVLLLLIAAWMALMLIGYAGGPGCTAPEAVEIGIELCATGAVLLAGAGLRRALASKPSHIVRRPIVTTLSRVRRPVEYMRPATPGAPRLALSQILLV